MDEYDLFEERRWRKEAFERFLDADRRREEHDEDRRVATEREEAL